MQHNVGHPIDKLNKFYLNVRYIRVAK